MSNVILIIKLLMQNYSFGFRILKRQKKKKKLKTTNFFKYLTLVHNKSFWNYCKKKMELKNIKQSNF